jgi:hypothetical protein
MAHEKPRANREKPVGQEPDEEERDEEALDLPDREAMTILDVMPTGIGGIGLPTSPSGGLGIPNPSAGVPLPTQGVPGAELPQPDPGMPYEPTQSTTTKS